MRQQRHARCGKRRQRFCDVLRAGIGEIVDACVAANASLCQPALRKPALLLQHCASLAAQIHPTAATPVLTAAAAAHVRRGSLSFPGNCVCYTRSVLHVPEGEKKLLKPRAPSRSIALSSPVSCELAGTMPPQNPTSTMTLPCETLRTSSLLQNCGLQVTQSHGLTMWNGAPCRTEGAASAPTLP